MYIYYLWDFNTWGVILHKMYYDINILKRISSISQQFAVQVVSHMHDYLQMKAESAAGV